MALYVNGNKVAGSLVVDGQSPVAELEFVDIGTLVPNVYIDRGSGSEIGYGGWYATDFLDIGDYSIVYRVSSLLGADWNAWYDSNKTYISGFGSSSVDNVPTGAKYVRYSSDSRMTDTNNRAIGYKST